ncbi:hypothetical protein DPMN_016233 [Dreissena polymorpha]|uniref:Lipoxygenase domain-containing protein n=1 Tax=Dreissena polymorpha TaxID=45954 RepID=A0A9D4ND36_DREPO|nr:hypothetical protein DPMN_016233 [Dreissena polymorpha]
MQRFAGRNKEMIRLCTKIPEKFAVTAEMLKPFLQNDTLRSELSNKRFFVIDHSILNKSKKGNGSVVCSPIALFYRRNDDKIVPIAVQLFQDNADDNPVSFPSDSKYTWILAKMWFNNADACVPQSISHLGYTHIVMKGFAVSVHRHLSQSHPMFKLIAPHFMYMMTINELAVGTLLKKGGFIDTVVSVGTEGAFELPNQMEAQRGRNAPGQPQREGCRQPRSSFLLPLLG